MKKFILLISLLFISLCFVTKVQAKNNSNEFYYEEETRIEKKAVVNWILEKYSKNVNLKQATNIVDLVYEFSEVNQLNPYLVIALIENESGFNHKARSPYGAVGLMQVVPRYHRNKLKNRNPTIKSVSIEVGSQILKDCLISKKGNTRNGLKCYSGGARYNDKVKKSHEEVRAYVVAYQFTNQHATLSTEYKFSKPFIYWPPTGNQTQNVLTSL